MQLIALGDLMSTNAYSPFKIVHHPDRIAALRNGSQVVPVQAQLIISDLCNQDCNFCAYRMSGYTSNQLFGVKREDGSVDNNPNRMIPYVKVLEILDDFAIMGVKAVQITGGGEPTVHPKAAEIMYAVVDRGLDLAVVSNGMLMKQSILEAYVKATWVRFSIDAGKAQTYADIRRVKPEVFQRVQDNINALVNLRAIRGSNVTIGVGYVVTKDNWQEIVEGVSIARHLGADNIRLSALFQNDDSSYFDGIYHRVRELIQQARAEHESQFFKVYDNFGERHDDLVLQSPNYEFCGYQQLCTYIGADQNVYRCCNTAYNKQGMLGSLENQRFKDFWESEAKVQLIAQFDARSCERCMFNGKNRTIAYAIDRDADHVNFV